jgi:methylmalonyl-CoA/ethylmalonyl-CoA epimerase
MQFSFKVKINHIGIATSDYQKTSSFYIALGYHEVVGGFDAAQNVYGYFYEAQGMPTIELLVPNDEKSPINRILSKNGVTPYHLCYELIDTTMEEAIIELKKNRFVQTGYPTISTSLGNRKVCFLFHKDVGIIEILENGRFKK